MSADLFDKRFYSHRLPAWHQLGIVSDTARTASDALTLIGDYRVTLEPVAVPTVGLSSFGSHAIVRHPVADDAEREPAEGPKQADAERADKSGHGG